MSLVTLALGEAIKARGRELGFDAVAIGPSGRAPHAEAFERWLDAGHAGTMHYLERTRAERVDPERLLPGVRSVIAVALVYRPRNEIPAGVRDVTTAAQIEKEAPVTTAPGSETDWAVPSPARPSTGETVREAAPPFRGSKITRSWRGVARYARGRDYHDVIRPRLTQLAEYVGDAAGPGVRSRVAVDTSAVLERDLAARAGLGWIGKNTNLLSEALGSYFFIGVVLTTAVLAHDQPVPDRCGTCTACLDACPTAAFPASHVLDARRCISYLTIEHRGDVEESLRPAIGEWLFGCDVCQDVCPWNRKAPASRDADLEAREPLPPLEALVALDDTSFRARFRGTAIWRTKRAGLVRNAALVLGNRGDASAKPTLHAALHDPDAAVREAAAWALDQLGRR